MDTDGTDRGPALSEEKMLPRKSKDLIEAGTLVESERGEVINASGHRDQLQRQYSLLSICGLALTIDNAWVALGGSITVSIGTFACSGSQSMRAVVLMDLQPMVGRLASCTSSWSHASTTASLRHQLQRYIHLLLDFAFPSANTSS